MKPIETAPKDGTEILLLINNGWEVGYWYQSEYDVNSHYWDVSLSSYHGCGCCADKPPQDKVTHWLPLPPTNEKP